MAAAEHNTIVNMQSISEAHVVLYRTSGSLLEGKRNTFYDPRLAEEIDQLRKEMTDTYLQIESLTADDVIELSRRLDDKINEYMKLVLDNRE